MGKLIVGIIVAIIGAFATIKAAQYSSKPPDNAQQTDQAHQGVTNSNTLGEAQTLHNVTIVGHYTHSSPGSFQDHFFCNVEYPVKGSALPHPEVLEDVDAGTKTNSADVYQLCTEYDQNSKGVDAGKPVMLTVTGTRDSTRSLYRNIVLFSAQ